MTFDERLAKLKSMSKADLIGLIEEIHDIMFTVVDDEVYLDPQKEWSPDTLEDIGSAIDRFGLRPD